MAINTAIILLRYSEPISSRSKNIAPTDSGASKAGAVLIAAKNEKKEKQRKAICTNWKRHIEVLSQRAYRISTASQLEINQQIAHGRVRDYFRISIIATRTEARWILYAIGIENMQRWISTHTYNMHIYSEKLVASDRLHNSSKLRRARKAISASILISADAREEREREARIWAFPLGASFKNAPPGIHLPCSLEWRLLIGGRWWQGAHT